MNRTAEVWSSDRLQDIAQQYVVSMMNVRSRVVPAVHASNRLHCACIVRRCRTFLAWLYARNGIVEETFTLMESLYTSSRSLTRTAATYLCRVRHSLTNPVAHDTRHRALRESQLTREDIQNIIPIFAFGHPSPHLAGGLTSWESQYLEHTMSRR